MKPKDRIMNPMISPILLPHWRRLPQDAQEALVYGKLRRLVRDNPSTGFTFDYAMMCLELTERDFDLLTKAIKKLHATNQIEYNNRKTVFSWKS